MKYKLDKDIEKRSNVYKEHLKLEELDEIRKILQRIEYQLKKLNDD